eukprot:TRINITY_DN10823_c0_g1_i1.p1 TRINITY_DN10823_c0_g1~~TRINITY_DN10823_c0_g1_i1.p1  ORF type:complete len:169 (-),score=15.23 TRINITY_DN10823_c0_g1_i1:208-714(-)
MKLFYAAMGFKYYDSMKGLDKFKLLSVEQQIRSLKLILFDKPYTFVKRTNFMKKARAKLNWFNANYRYFVNQRWCFDHSNIKSLYSLLDSESKKKYDIHVNKINFNKYACESALVCFKKYINYKDEKKKNPVEVEKDLKQKLDVLIEQYQESLSDGNDTKQFYPKMKS